MRTPTPAIMAAIMAAVTRIVHVPYVVEQDEDGVWVRPPDELTLTLDVA